MIRKYIWVVLCIGLLGQSRAENLKPIDYVNPNIGSVHSRWFFYTPAAEPFGMKTDILPSMGFPVFMSFR